MDRLLRVRAYLRLADVTHVETHRHEGQDAAHVDPLMLSHIEAHIWQTDGQVSLHDWLVVYAREQKLHDNPKQKPKQRPTKRHLAELLQYIHGRQTLTVHKFQQHEEDYKCSAIVK